MLQKTKAIVLRSVKYGETSLIVSMLTSEMGLQSYIINGVRTEKKSSNKASHYLPGSLLQLEAYHREGKSINRIKEAYSLKLLTSNAADPIRNAAVLFMMELTEKCLKHPEKNEPLFQFISENLESMDACQKVEIMPQLLSFALSLPEKLGLGIEKPMEETSPGKELFLDLSEGCFVMQIPSGSQALSQEHSWLAASILNGNRSEVPDETALNMLERFMLFYLLHFPEFGKMKTLTFLREMFL